MLVDKEKLKQAMFEVDDLRHKIFNSSRKVSETALLYEKGADGVTRKDVETRMKALVYHLLTLNSLYSEDHNDVFIFERIDTRNMDQVKRLINECHEALFETL